MCPRSLGESRIVEHLEGGYTPKPTGQWLVASRAPLLEFSRAWAAELEAAPS